MTRFARDSSKFWYKPTITREEAISLLRNAQPGTFLVRDSTTFASEFTKFWLIFLNFKLKFLPRCFRFGGSCRSTPTGIERWSRWTRSPLFGGAYSSRRPLEGMQQRTSLQLIVSAHLSAFSHAFGTSVPFKPARTWHSTAEFLIASSAAVGVSRSCL